MRLALPDGCPQPPHELSEAAAAIWIRMAPSWWRAGLLRANDLTSTWFALFVESAVSYFDAHRTHDDANRPEAAEHRRQARLYAADCKLLPGGREHLAPLDAAGEDGELKRLLKMQS